MRKTANIPNTCEGVANCCNRCYPQSICILISATREVLKGVKENYCQFNFNKTFLKMRYIYNIYIYELSNRVD